MRKKIAAGVYLNTIPTKKFKTTRMVITFISKPKTTRQVASRALLTNYLEMSNEKFETQIEISKELSKMYGAGLGTGVSKKGNYSVTTFSLSYVESKYLKNTKDLLNQAQDFLKTIIFQPMFKSPLRDEVFERQKNNIITYLESMRDDKQAYAQKKLRELYFESEIQAASALGKLEDFKKLTLADLIKSHEEMINSERVEILVAGNIDEQAVYTSFKELGFKNRLEEYPLDDVIFSQKLSDVKFEDELQAGLLQSKLNLAYKLPVEFRGANHYAALVFNSLFGGSAQSLLFTEVREKNSLAYYANSSFDPFREYLMVQTGIDGKNKDKVIAIIEEQLRKIQAGEFSDELLEQNKMNLINLYISRLDSQVALIARAQTDIMFDSTVQANDWVKKIKEVTKEDIKEVAQLVKLQAVYYLGAKEE